jgi:hypothetical protein
LLLQNNLIEMMQKTIECPVDFVSVNETQVRTTAFLVLLAAAAWVLTGSVFIIVFLVPDFFLRAFNYGKFSPLNIVSKFIVKQLKLPVKLIDQAPKRFAAKIGLAFTISITVLQLLQYSTAATALAAVLIFFALLESVFGFCAGCYAYTFYKKIFLKK